MVRQSSKIIETLKIVIILGKSSIIDWFKLYLPDENMV